MFTYKTSPDEPAKIDALLHPTLKKWFYDTYPSYSLTQLYGVCEIHARNHVLLSAPTGSSKTLTTFLSILNELVDLATSDRLKDQVYVIYISPLKALNEDIARNLIEPLAQMGLTNKIRVATRTSDTTPSARAKQKTTPPHILVTTPESLALMLTSGMRANFGNVEWVIIDEVHALANKRGVYLGLMLQTLARFAHFSRIAISATVPDLEKVAGYFMHNLPCKLIQVPLTKDVSLHVDSLGSYISESYELLYERLLQKMRMYIMSHRSTVIFTNTRATTERLVHDLKEKYPDDFYEIHEEPPFEKSQLIAAHHSAVAPQIRQDMEQKLKAGKLKAIICSTSLELGIDIGYVDLVIQVGSPKHIARLLQRVGRSGHKLHATPKGVLFGLDLDDAIECVAVCMCGKDAQLDAALMPLNTLDVLSQWLVLQSLVEPLTAQEAFDTAKLCGMFESLTRYAFDSVVEALTIEDEDLAKYHVYPKLKFEEQKLVPARKGVVLLFRQNVGTILQQGTVRVRVQEAIVGYLDEEFAQLLKPGDVFVLAGQTYVCTRLQGMTLFAQETHVRKPTIPRWRSTSLYTSALVAKKAQQLKTGLDALYCEPELAKQIAMYVKLQKLALSKGELVEYYKDNGVVYTIVHAGCGRAITECLASVFVYAAQKKYNTVFQSSATDTGFFIAGSQGVAIDKLTSDVLPGFTQILDHALTESEQVKRRFRSVATRSLLLIQNYMSVRKSIGRQQMTGQLLYYALRAHPGHMLPKAALQEAKENLDVPGAIEYLPKLVDAKHTDYTHLPSPFAAGIVASALDMLTPKDKQRFFVTLLAMHSMPKKEQVFTYAQAWDEMQVVTQSMYETYLGVKPRLRLDPQIQFELERMLTGSIDGFSATYLAWLDGLLSGTIPKIWPDAVILALKEARIQVRSV